MQAQRTATCRTRNSRPLRRHLRALRSAFRSSFAPARAAAAATHRSVALSTQTFACRAGAPEPSRQRSNFVCFCFFLCLSKNKRVSGALALRLARRLVLRARRVRLTSAARAHKRRRAPVVRRRQSAARATADARQTRSSSSGRRAARRAARRRSVGDTDDTTNGKATKQTTTRSTRVRACVRAHFENRRHIAAIVVLLVC